MKKSVNTLPAYVYWPLLYAIAAVTAGFPVLLLSAVLLDPEIAEAGAWLISSGVVTLFLIIIFYPRE